MREPIKIELESEHAVLLVLSLKDFANVVRERLEAAKTDGRPYDSGGHYPDQLRWLARYIESRLQVTNERGIK